MQFATFTLVDATYEALTVRMTAFMRFLAAVINDVALSSCQGENIDNYKQEQNTKRTLRLSLVTLS